MALLDYHGIAVSGGSACSAQEDKPSHVLKAIGLSDEAAEESIRVSLGHETSARDIQYTIRVFQRCIKDRNLLIDMTTSDELDKQKLFDEHTIILDVRPQFMRNKLRSLPNSHEASFFSIKRILNEIPKDKNILVVCQHGNLSYIAGTYLRSNGIKQVSSLMAGIVDWKAHNNELYKQYAGQHTTKL